MIDFHAEIRPRLPGIWHPAATSLFLLTAAILLSANAGCVIPIPIAIFPAPCLASGQELRFHDGRGNWIQRDGLLIVSRSQSIRGYLPRCAPSNHVVQIRRGRARIPHEWVPATLWLWPNEMVVGHWLMAMTVNPLLALVGTPLAAIPVPILHPFEDRIFVIPLIPGYHQRQIVPGYAPGFKRIDLPYVDSVEPPHSRDPIVLAPNTESPSMARSYWNEVHQRLRRRFEPIRIESGPDLRLSHYHYPRVKAFIQRELQRIESIKTKAKPTTRSTQQRGSSLSPESDSKP